MSLFLHFTTLLDPLVEGSAVGRHPGVAQPVELVPRPGRPDAQLAVRDECLAAPGLPHTVLGQEPLLGQAESLLDEVQGDVGGPGEVARGKLVHPPHVDNQRAAVPHRGGHLAVAATHAERS